MIAVHRAAHQLNAVLAMAHTILILLNFDKIRFSQTDCDVPHCKVKHCMRLIVSCVHLPDRTSILQSSSPARSLALFDPNFCPRIHLHSSGQARQAVCVLLNVRISLSDMAYSPIVPSSLRQLLNNLLT